ncbi:MULTISPECIES: DUF3413 domain-containing protein [unclassified Shewanella]|uniref:DUF3413 domain-containing protein n=1 Tax=unclassified Shewanella TaxID=196818 RepID=UPI000C86203F|nr:DUF3413 domain-containing protein [Shewanella sp. 10N.286.51.B7]PMG76377.1 sulfatase [Shewanella sp. 10N.286.51.B7]
MVERKKQMTRDKVSRLVNWGHWFAFFNGFLAMIIGARYLSSVGYPETIIGWGYLAISTIGHFSFLAFIVYVVFLFPITLLLPYSKILRGYAALVATLGLCILLYDTIVFDDYGIHLSPFAFDLAWTDLNALLKSTSYIATPTAIILIELTAANFIWKRIEKLEKKQFGNKAIAFVGICFISSHLVHIWADASDVTQITRFDDTYPLSYPATARSFMESHGIEGTNSDDNRYQTKSRNLSYPILPLQCKDPALLSQQTNVLIVSVDGLRADMVNELTMPFLSQYQNDNKQFTDHFSGGNQFKTGMFAMFYGLQGNYGDRKEFYHTPPVMTVAMDQAGYQQAIFLSEENEKVFDNRSIFDGLSVITNESEEGSAQTDMKNVQAFIDWSASQQSHWFSLVNLSAPKHYDTPIGFLGIETIKPHIDVKPAQKVLYNQYRQSLYFIDQQLKELLNHVGDDTLIMITGTHGQIFSSNPSEVNQDLSPGNVKVPFVMHWPKVSADTVSYRTSHFGIVPTIMSQVLHCNNSTTDYSSGYSLLQPSQQKWVYIGDSRTFAIYQKSEITVLDRHGKYRIYDINYQKQLKQKLSAPELIQVMREGRRLYNQ